MLTRTSRTAFRRAAIGAAAGLSLFTGASLLACYPASAADPVAKNPCAATYERYKKNPNDKTFGDDLGCGFEQIRKERAAAQKRAADARREATEARREGEAARREGEAARREGEAARREGEAARAVTACVDFLIEGVKKGTIIKEEIYQRAGGKEQLRVGDTACVIAKKYYGYGQKAEANPK